jgi:hypothetical protein
MLLPLVAVAMIAGAAPTPVVVELFTSEGCSSCPPVDLLLQELVEKQPVSGAEIVPLSWHVDYWDYIGWRDPFDAPEFSDRQNAYASVFGENSVYTPQFVIDGAAHFPASRARAFEAIGQAAGTAHASVKVNAKAGAGGIAVELEVGALPGGGNADAWVAITEGPLSSKVQAGENRGRVLTHVAVVRSLTLLGRIAAAGGHVAKTIKIDPAWKRESLAVVAFVQRAGHGSILGTARVAPVQPERRSDAPESKAQKL